MKIKTGLMAILPILVGGYALDVSAVGKSYEFTAEFGYSDMMRDVSFYDYNSGNSYYLDYYEDSSPEFDPTNNFVASNQTITGQFSYNTSAPINYFSSGDTWNYTSYNAEDFSVNLSSQNGENGRFNILNPSVSLYNYGENHRVGISGWRVNSPVSLGGDSGSCGEFGCWEQPTFYGMLPIEQLQDDQPELFNNISTVEVAIYSYFESSATYDLSHVDVSARADELPADGSLPESLPALNDMDYASLNLEFSQYLGGPGGEYIDGVEVLYIEGEFSSEEERYEKEDQIGEFVMGLEPELYSSAYVGYNLTGLTELADGVTPYNPLLPDSESTSEEGFEFTFQPNETDFTFIDPEVSVGYDYEVLDGANFLAVLLPEGIGDNLYDLLLFDEELGEFVDSGIDLTGGVAYSFGEDGLSLFRIAGIEIDENLDPDDPLAFVTGLKFLTDGEVSISQTAITQTVVPVPPSLLLFMSGIVGLAFRARKALI